MDVGRGAALTLSWELFSPDAGTFQPAIDRLTALQKHADTPVIHRADIVHNLGIAWERWNDQEHALRWYRRALDLNPLLDASRTCAERLGVKIPLS